ncbi:hypothetical protein FHX57_001986 [Paraburkholderia tropica]|uniref:phage adaptor protein n=1 Tax=Paraburkholderia tropica TaxID=92647 RepID=UPI00161F8429|nr:hypothetical protein [Paraburkholderia tropica]MBB2999655.1 hypothetical protein [Paraburkholderia tropica]
MPLQSYSDLQASMGRWLKRPDLQGLFPDFITLAEQNFDRKIKTRSRRARYSITPTTNRIALPSDWGRVISAEFDSKPLGFFPASTDARMIAFGYQIKGNSLFLTVPQLGTRLSLEYYVVIEPLSTSNSSNWLLQDAPDIYLWGALAEAADYIRDDTSQQKWLARRDQAISDFIDDDSEAKTPEDQPLNMRAS